MIIQRGFEETLCALDTFFLQSLEEESNQIYIKSDKEDKKKYWKIISKLSRGRMHLENQKTEKELQKLKF